MAGGNGLNSFFLSRAISAHMFGENLPNALHDPGLRECPIDLANDLDVAFVHPPLQDIKRVGS